MATIENYKFLILLISVFHLPKPADNTGGGIAVGAGVFTVVVLIPTAHWLLSKSQPVQRWVLNLIKCMTQAEFIPRDLVLDEVSLHRLNQIIENKQKFLNCGILTFVVCGPVHQIRWGLNFALFIVKNPRAFGKTVVSPISCTLRMVCLLFRTCVRRHENLLVHFAKDINDQQFLSNQNGLGYTPNVDELPDDKFLLPFLTKIDLSFLSKKTPKFLSSKIPNFPLTILRKPFGLLKSFFPNSPKNPNIEVNPQFPNVGIQFPKGTPGVPGVNVYPPQPPSVIIERNPQTVIPPQNPSVVVVQNPPNVIVKENPPKVIQPQPPSVIVVQDPPNVFPPQNPPIILEQNPPNVFPPIIIERDPPKDIIIYSDDEPIIRQPSEITFDSNIRTGPMVHSYI